MKKINDVSMLKNMYNMKNLEKFTSRRILPGERTKDGSPVDGKGKGKRFRGTCAACGGFPRTPGNAGNWRAPFWMFKIESAARRYLKSKIILDAGCSENHHVCAEFCRTMRMCEISVPAFLM